MNIKTRFWIIIFLISFQQFSQAQYFDVTHRQSPDEITMLRDHNIQKKISYLQQADNTAPFGVNYYDTGGRVIFIANPNHHEHFKYDDKGRMTYWLDSANDGRRFEKHEYYFGYDSKGALNQYKTDNTESKIFNMGPDIQEDVMRKGLVLEVRKYSYNNDGKLSLEVFREPGNDSIAKIIHSHKIFYNKYGDLASEIIYNAIKDCKGDSTVTINTYDNKGKVIHRQKSSKILSCGASPAITDRKTISESISYVYNAGGLLVSESMISNNPSLNYKKEYVYDEYGIPVKELGFDGKGKPTTNILYSYTYFPVKRK